MRQKLRFARSHTLAILFVAVLLCAALMFVFIPAANSAKAAGEHDHTTEYTGGGGNLTSGSYYLEDNATITTPIVIRNGVTVNFCLSGHTISRHSSSGVMSIFRIENGGTLNLYDEGNGSITGGRGTTSGSNQNGGGVYVMSGGTFNMYGGEITGNSATYGGGVEVEGGEFNMYGGKITDNEATEGGGVNVSSSGEFNMYGGEISGNTAVTNGGGVFLTNYGGAVTFNMSGGTITNNSAESGGGVYVGGSATPGANTFSVSGVVNVTGNTGGNVFILNGYPMTVGGSLKNGNQKAQIGITFNGTNTVFANNFSTTNPSENPSDYFISDKAIYYCALSGGNVVLNSKSTITATDIITNWKANNVSLADGEIYIKDGQVYRSNPGSADSQRTVTNSIANYENGEAITVRLSTEDNERFKVSYSQNVGSENGIYTAFATLTAETAYFFSQTETFYDEYGIVVMSNNGEVLFLSKTWYIAEADNAILDEEESISLGTPVLFKVPNRVYGEEVELATPRLKFGNNAANELTFTLTKDNTSIVTEAVTIDDLGDYINKSMPAGHYVLTVKAAAVPVEAGTNWWDNSERAADECGAFEIEYEFDVAAAAIDLGMTSVSGSGYKSYEWKYDKDAKAEFFDAFATELAGSISLVKTYNSKNQRIGYWATDAAGSYYGNYSVTYNLLRMRDNTYYRADATDILDYIEMGVGGTYTVYFRVSAPNHATVSAEMNRYSYYFTVVIYEELKSPAPVNTVTYTGSKVAVPLDASSLYEIALNADDDYIDGGTHYVTLKLLDPVHYHWATGLTTSGDNNENLTWEFEIACAENNWIRIPDVVGWECGAYTPSSNPIVAVPKFGEFKDVKYTITTDEAGNTPVNDTLKGFTVTYDADGNAVIDDAVIAEIKKLPRDTYWLLAEVAKTANYQGLRATTSFSVTFTANYWKSPLSIVAWADGDYNVNKNIVTAEAAVGDVVIVIINTKDNKEYFNSATGLNNLKKAPVGEYRLTAIVEATDSYSALSDSITFNVFEAPGLAWWIWLLIIFGILLILFLIGLTLVKTGVISLVTEKMVVAMRTRADADATIAAVRAGKVAAEAERLAELARKEASAAADAIAAEEGESDEEFEDDEEEDEENTVYEPDENDVEVPSGAGFQKVYAANTTDGSGVMYGKTVLSKLINSEDVVKNRYSEIKNYLLGYKKTRANMSRARESFYLGRKCYARIAIRGKTLCLYLALNPSDYTEKYNVEDVLSVKQYIDTPCLLRVRSDRALRYAKALIDALMTNIGAVAFERKPENYAALFNSIQQLEKKRLLSYGVKKQPSGTGAARNNPKEGDDK